jgi:prepilin-type processing-associated H-X9-DG protein
MLTNGVSIKEQNIRYSSDTVVLGEKLSDAGDYYMDLFENPQVGGNDMSIAEQWRHDNRNASSQAGQSGSGGSNYVMADGSARFIKYPQAVAPLHLWGISDTDRTLNAWKF